jgi:hypothetical protein
LVTLSNEVPQCSLPEPCLDIESDLFVHQSVVPPSARKMMERRRKLCRPTRPPTRSQCHRNHTSPINVKAAHELGADQVVDHTKTRFEDAIEPVDLCLRHCGRREARTSELFVTDWAATLANVQLNIAAGFFVDRSQAGAGCSMADCGNRAKARWNCRRKQKGIAKRPGGKE